MNSEFRGPLTEGHAFRVTLSHLTPPESYLGVYVRFDVESNLVHIFGPDSKTLYHEQSSCHTVPVPWAIGSGRRDVPSNTSAE
jgi:hypothetical protein